MVIFNRQLLRQNRCRASKNLNQADFLINESSQIIIEKILDYQRDSCENFDYILEISARDGRLGKQILKSSSGQTLIQSDCSHKMALSNLHHLKLIMDDEQFAFKNQSFDLVVSNLNLHFINNLPQNLIAIKNLLKTPGKTSSNNGGMFIASFFGEENLKELRQVFYQIEQEKYQGIAPRIMPNIDVKTAGMLLQKAGFSDVVAEKHSIEVYYSSPIKLLQDLKLMGEANILSNRSRKFMTRNFLSSLLDCYANQYSNDNGQAIATFEIIILTGWRKN